MFMFHLFSIRKAKNNKQTKTDQKEKKKRILRITGKGKKNNPKSKQWEK